MLKIFKWVGLIYRVIGVTILKFLNYNMIQNPNGSYHIVLNSIDFLLAISYLCVSFWKMGAVTVLVLIVNLITLCKLIVKDLKASSNLRNEYKKLYDKKPGLQYKSPYDFKLIVEFLLIIFTFVPTWIQGRILNDYTVQSFTILVIILSFTEHTINVLSDLFEAKISLKSIVTN